MSEDLERLGRQAGIAKWMGIIGIPSAPSWALVCWWAFLGLP